jgi:hypothetical protein
MSRSTHVPCNHLDLSDDRMTPEYKALLEGRFKLADELTKQERRVAQRRRTILLLLFALLLSSIVFSFVFVRVAAADPVCDPQADPLCDVWPEPVFLGIERYEDGSCAAVSLYGDVYQYTPIECPPLQVFLPIVPVGAATEMAPGPNSSVLLAVTASEMSDWTHCEYSFRLWDPQAGAWVSDEWSEEYHIDTGRCVGLAAYD